MDSPVSFKLKDQYLLVTGHGSRDNLASMVEASRIIYEKVLETNSRHLLVDYRNLEINVHMAEAYNIVRSYEKRQPDLKHVIIAAVSATKTLTSALIGKRSGASADSLLRSSRI